MGGDLTYVPAHLRRFVVEQDYGQYNAVDQAVWRFVLLQMRARLADTAHPVYNAGLGATGISVDRIPSIAEMNERLSRFGWGAVCVDGFVPPRAFQEFQAHGILPIAAEIRTRQHLAYTPAPDIIHEAAGHAPILPNPTYARYLRRIGELGAQAFTVPADDDVFHAVHALSVVKEDPSASGEDIARVEARLQTAIESVPEASEAARLARLYWWTAEYGLIGRPDDYKIYGAGLLSSLGESHSCHAPAVRKLPLDGSCIEVGYDITRPQPQLFVTPSFDALHDVLDGIVRRLRQGGVVAALDRAWRSRELASVELSSGGWITGVLAEVGPSFHSPAWLAFDGPVGFSWAEELGAARGVQPHGSNLHESRPADARQWIVTGRLADGRALEGLTDKDIEAYRQPADGRYRFTFASGAEIEGGRLERRMRRPDGRLGQIDLGDARLVLPGRPAQVMERTVLFAAGDVVGARAGAVDPTFHGDTAYSSTRVPRPRSLPVEERRLFGLFERAEAAARDGQPEAVAREFAAVHAELARAYPNEWLVRWNMLESLRKAPNHDALKRALWDELERLEVALGYRQPIASGLRYLRAS